jgi:hypothetical protein
VVEGSKVGVIITINIIFFISVFFPFNYFIHVVYSHTTPTPIPIPIPIPTPWEAAA